MPLPAAALAILDAYLRADRACAAPTEPLFVVTFRTRGDTRATRRMTGHRIWKIVKDLGRRVGIPELHPHGNLRAVQEHLRHKDVQTTTVYTKVTQQDLWQQLRVFDHDGDGKGDSRPSPQGN